MLKAPAEAIMGARLDQFIEPSERSTLQVLLERGKAEMCAAEYNFRRPDKGVVPVQLAVSPLQLHDRPGVCVIATDLVEQKRIQEELRNLSLTDELTGLHNRRGFFALLHQQLKVARRLNGELLLCYGDLDGLKEINDRLGHREGDRALIDAAGLLRRTFRESDIVARLGGDEFGVAAIWSRSMDPALLTARLQGRVLEHNASAQRPYELSISVGMLRHDPASSASVEELLASVDAEMYRRKREKHGAAGMLGFAPSLRMCTESVEV
jgi:diguanylate cyclase (GGDEF)-like protein